MALIVTPWQLRRTSEFYRELASLLGAGIPAVQALQHVQRASPGRGFHRGVTAALSSIQAGAGFTEGLAGEAGWLPAFDLALLRAGETSGRLVESCRALADHYDSRARLMAQLVVKLLYPVFLFHFAVLVFPPSMIADLVIKLQVGAFVAQKLSVLLPVYGAGLVLLVALQRGRSTAWQAGIESVLGLVPVLGNARREMAHARLAAALEALISAGMGIVESWEMAAEASGSPAIARVVRRWREPIQAGVLPSELVRGSRVFTEMFANLYFTGETSGQLDQELRHLSTYYQDSGLRKLNAFVLGLVVLISLGVMLAVGFFIIRFWLGYFNQISNVLGS